MKGNMKWCALTVGLTFLLIFWGCGRKKSHNYVEDFWHAIERGDVRKAKAMLAKYPFISQRVLRQGKTALHVAASSGQTEIASLVIQYWKKGGVHVVDVPDAPHKRTPLHYAVLANHQDVVKLLLANGASVRLEDSAGYTALHFAAQQGNNDVVRILIAAGAHISVISRDGLTPLEMAVQNGHTETVELLQMLRRNRSGK